MAYNRRIDIPENVGLRPLAKAAGAGAPLSHEDMNPGARETDNSAGGDDGDRGIAHAGAAHTAATMHEGDSRP